MSDSLYGELVYGGFAKVYLHPRTRHEVVRCTDSIAFLIHLVDRDTVMLVEQQRGPMVRIDNPEGNIVEVTAGRFDVNLTPEELGAKEALEEVGATISPSDVVLINGGVPLALSPGIITERQYLAYVPINSSAIESVERIFGVEGEESITRREISLEKLSTMVFEDMKTFALVQWFINRLRAEGRNI